MIYLLEIIYFKSKSYPKRPYRSQQLIHHHTPNTPNTISCKRPSLHPYTLISILDPVHIKHKLHLFQSPYSSQTTSEEHRVKVLILMHKCGYSKPATTYPERVRITKVASNLVAYDKGYPHMMWNKTIDVKFVSGDKESDGNVGSTSYIDTVDVKHPGYLYYLHRYVTNAFRAKYSFELLSTAMNKKATHQHMIR